MQTDLARPDAETVRAWISVVRTYNLCDAVMAKRLAQLGLKVAEHEILINLLREPGMSQQSLVRRCFTAKSHMSGLISTLEQNGHVLREPDPSDARAKKLRLTSLGEDLARQALGVQNQVVAAMVGPLTHADVQTIAKTTALMSAELEKLLAA